MGLRIAGIQPGYLPWLGYFDQMLQVDAFLVADELPYTSSGWTRRNRVKGPGGPCWLTLPARARRREPIRDVRLDPAVPWARRHAAALRHCYAGAVDAEAGIAGFERAVAGAPPLLVAAALPTIRWLAERLDVRTPLLLSSQLGLERRYRERCADDLGPTQRIAAYMEALGASELLEGESGRAYLDVRRLESHGLRVRFHHYVHPEYPQLHGPFASHLSALDLLLCVGEERARAVLRSGRSL